MSTQNENLKETNRSEIVEGNGNVDNMRETEKNIFGSDSDDSDNEIEPIQASEKGEATNSDAITSSEIDGEMSVAPKKVDTTNSNTMASIFGEDSDSDNGSDDVITGDELNKIEEIQTNENMKAENNMDFMYEDDETSKFKQQSTHANLCISRHAKISEQTDALSLRLPNFLKLQTNPYNKMNHNEEAEASLFAGATSMIRWRYKLNQNGDIAMDDKGLPVRESNARLVKWTDGSYQLLVGQEIFDSSTFPVAESYIYAQRKSAPPSTDDPVFDSVSEEEKKEIKTSMCLECVGSSSQRIVLRPSSVVSAAHARLSLAISEKYSRKTKIKGREDDSVIINAEKQTSDRVAAINDKLRRERRRRSTNESSFSSYRQNKPTMSSQFLEEEDRFDSTSIRDIKKGKNFNIRKRYNSDDDDDEFEDEKDDDDDGFIVNDDEMEDYEDGDWDDGSDDDAPKKSKSSGILSRKKDSSDSDQDSAEDFEPGKMKNSDNQIDDDDDVEGVTGKKRRRAIIDSDDD